MTLHLLLSNLAAYSVQIAVIIVVGSTLPYLLRIERPGVMLIYRQMLLAACLLLPLLQPWQRPVIESPHGVMTLQVSVVNRSPAVPRHIPWEKIAAWTLCAGALVRLCWLGIGLNRLRVRRRGAELLLPLPAIFEDLQSGLDVHPTVGISTQISGPVTFGIRRPMILLPSQFLDLPFSAQKAIVCHEMTHIRRGDWAFTMGEEAIRALFWFHPCVWWLLGQIQLTREQAVDCEVIDITAAPEQYIHALLAVAGSRLQADLAPTPLFLRKSHLTRRVTLILKGVSMSQRRLFSSLAAVCGAVFVAARLTVLTFPIVAPAQEVVRGETNLLHRTPIQYPPEAIEKGIQGTVVVEATLNERGVVTDARVVSGPEPLRKAALKSVLEWHYSGQALSPVEVAIDFKLPVKRPDGVIGGVVNGPGGGTGITGGIAGGVTGGVTTVLDGQSSATVADAERRRAALETLRAMAGQGRIKLLRISGVSDQLREALESRISVREGDVVQPDTLTRVRQVVKELDEHLDARLSYMVRDGEPGSELYIFSTAPMVSPSATTVPGSIRVGGNVQAELRESGPNPAYPPLAKQARIQGTVRLNALIGKNGTIQNLSVASGHPLLAPAALEAVKQWVYKPTLSNGEPTEVVTVIDVNFTLSE